VCPPLLDLTVEETQALREILVQGGFLA
jgi:hypothetical protein